MENLILQPVNNQRVLLPAIISSPSEETSSDNSFIKANTVECSLQEIKDHHLIPVFVKDNERAISIAEFIEAAQETVLNVFSEQTIYHPSIRLSHPIKNRVPEAKDKPANQLEEWEKTLYYERAAFVIEIPGIQSVVDGNTLTLTVGGVKSYSMDNLNGKKGVDEHFKIFIGFQNKVCCNMCVWTDGYMNNISVKNVGQLKVLMHTLFQSYNSNHHLYHLQKLSEYHLTDHQFALLMGRCRLYQHLPPSIKNTIPPLLFGETQLSAIAKDYYRDESFCRNAEGDINLWKLYNLFTGSNKSSYIENFLERGVNAYQFAEQLRRALENKADSWFLN